MGGDRGRVDRAIEDLQTLGFWRPLTRHLYYLRIGSRPGVESIPEDGHLADALFSARFDRRGSGLFCDIVIFVAAIDADRARWAAYYAAGRQRPPPSRRQFWAGVLAHELAHCRPGPHGERVAERWEERVLTALQRGKS